jgi:PPK2 family polyphosphate:nucleotide phosphotransferase
LTSHEAYRERFKVIPGTRVRLSHIDPGFKDQHANKAAAKKQMERDDFRLTKLQRLLYAEHNRSLLICLQGVDAAGKDGTISHVFRALNPQGARVHAFKVPSKEEADHDFLWRVHLHVPAKGEIVMFNRSQYEAVLVERVHKLVPEPVWAKRYELINDFERNLTLAGTTILKFFLHISDEEQLRRFKKRLDNRARQWKIGEADYSDRAYFNEFLNAYDAVLEKTSTPYAPWFVIPSDRKWFRNLAVSKIVAETLEAFDMHFPSPSVDLEKIRRSYHAAKQDSEG